MEDVLIREAPETTDTTAPVERPIARGAAQVEVEITANLKLQQARPHRARRRAHARENPVVGTAWVFEKNVRGCAGNA